MRGMTSYSWAERRGKNFSLEVTLRSINSKYLEIFTNLPGEKIFLEELIKKEIKKRFNRGRIDIYFSLHCQPKQRLIIDEGLLSQYYSQIQKIARKFKMSQENSVKNLFLLPGLIQLEAKKYIDNRLILSAFKEGLTKLIAFKEKEGALIKKAMIKHLKSIKDNMRKIRMTKVPLALEESTKDIEEEITLILFYINKLQKLVSTKKESFKGKAIDFLTQEILRELNAASSKTKIKRISWWLVETKSFLERIREQAQNIE